MDVTLTVNGEEKSASVPPETTLLRLLRDDLNLTGAKIGCDVGDCGACTVIMDGIAVNSCLVLAGQAGGRSVETIEGLADLVTTSLDGPEVSLDAAAELPNTVKLYPQEKWEWGWNNSSEVWNGRLAMLGFSAFLLELIGGRGPLHALGLL